MKRHVNKDLEKMLEEEMNSNSIIQKQEISFSQYNIHLDSAIEEPSKYRDVISLLFGAEDGDDVTIYINSPGGELDTALAIIEGIKHSRAHVRGVIIGACHSAASMISMYVDELLILDAAHSLVHTASMGTYGTTNNIKSHTDFTLKQVEKFLDTTYSGFLTADELAQVKLGVEFWFDADDLRARMTKRVAYLSKESKKTVKKEKKNESAI